VYVTEVTTEVAGKVELRRASKTPQAKPEAVASITAPAFGSVKMTPDGVQLLLMNLKRPLKVGETITLTLSTDSGSSMIAEAEVREK
jgi:periplasmic copper chaperone A